MSLYFIIFGANLVQLFLSEVLFRDGYFLATSWTLAAYFDPLLEARNVVAVVTRGHHIALVKLV